MNKILIIAGIFCSMITFLGLFTPWIELQSTPYKLGEARVKDHIKITGWDIILGKIQVVQMIESQECLCWRYYRTVELQVESKFYPVLCLIGGVLFLIGGISTLKLKDKVSLMIFLTGGLLVFICGVLGFINNIWVTPRTIIIEEYTIFGYYGYGLLICIIGGTLGVLASFFMWGIDTVKLCF